jgi:methylmalonyl-CoA/ethylmalonyl-CoA epimerase
LVKRLDHIAIAVHSLDEALSFYQSSLGLHCIGIETVEEQGVRVAKLEIGNTHIELLEPLSAETPVGKFLAQRGIISPGRPGRSAYRQRTKNWSRRCPHCFRAS